MGASIKADLALDDAGDPHTDDGEHRQSGNPCGFLEPPRGDGRWGLDPTKPRFHRGILVLIGLEKVGIATYLSAPGRGQHRPPLVLLRVGACRHCHPQARARRTRWRVHLGWPSAPRASQTAGGGDDTRADRMRPPQAGAAAALSRPLVRIRRAGGFGLSCTGTPAGGHPRPMVCHGRGCRRLGAGIGLGWLRGQLPCMPHEKAPLLLRPPPIAVRDLRRPADAWPMPTAARFGLGTPSLCCHKGQDGVLLAPGFPGVAHRTGAWHEGHYASPLFQTPASRPATLRLALRHAPLDPLQAQGEARRKRDRRLPTVTRIPIPHAEPQRAPPGATHAQTAEPRCAIVPTLLARPLGRAGGSRGPFCSRFLKNDGATASQR